MIILQDNPDSTKFTYQCKDCGTWLISENSSCDTCRAMIIKQFLYVSSIFVLVTSIIVGLIYQFHTQIGNYFIFIGKILNHIFFSSPPFVQGFSIAVILGLVGVLAVLVSSKGL